MRHLFVALMLLVLVPTVFAQAQAREFRYARPLRAGMSGADVKSLQEALKAIPDTFTEEASGYFGKMTEVAVKRLQEREGIARSGSVGYGQVGPKTAARIQELLADGKRVNTPTPIPVPTPTPTTTTTTTTSAPATSTVAQTPKSASTAPAADTTPPVRSGGYPSNVVSAGTTTVTISVSTNESARCYLSETRNTPYEYMARFMTPKAGGKLHLYTVERIAQVGYAFFVKCRDSALNANKGDYPILFWVEYGELGRDRFVPHVFMSAPTDGDSVSEGLTMLSAAASDNLGVVGVRFFLNGQDLNFEDKSDPFGVAVMLTPGSYKAFAVARDLAGNRATSTETSFTVTPKEPAKSSVGAPGRHAMLGNLGAALGPFLSDVLAAFLGLLFQ